ncbi:MAG: glycosyltransferase [Nitrospirota bacterium]
MKPLRVGHIIATNFFGGPEKQIVEHAQRSAGRDLSVVVISFIERSRRNELLERAADLGLDTHALHTNSPFNPKVIPELASFLKRNGIDLLCTHGYKSNVIGRAASWLAGRPEIAFSRGWTGEDRRIRLFEQLDRRFLRAADHVVAVSQSQRERVLSLNVPAGKVSVIHNCIDADRAAALPKQSIRAAFGLPREAVIVVSAGRLSPEKNFEGLLDAVQLAMKRDPRIHCIVFGEGAERENLEAKRSRYKLDGRFLLPGFRKDMMSFMADADIFVLPSLTEGLPNVVLEACALGKPVVATAVGGTPEIVRHGITGFLVKPGETRRMADYICRIARHRELGAAMGMSGHDYIRSHFGFDKQTAQLEHIYGEVYASFYHGRRTGKK